MARSDVWAVLGLCVLFSALHLASAHLTQHFSGQELWTFQLNKVSKENIQDGYRVRLFLEGSNLPTMTAHAFTVGNPHFEARLVDYMNLREGVPVDMTSDGVAQFDISLPPGYDLVLVGFHHNHGTHCAFLQLNTHTVSEQVMPNISFTIQGNATYYEGKDISLEVSYLVGGGHANVSSTSLGAELYTKSPSEENVIRPNRVEPHITKPSEAEVSSQLYISTAHGNTEGLLRIKTFSEFRCHGDCLLTMYHIDEQVPVHQQGHMNPFPDGFLGFTPPRYKPVPDMQYCLYGDPLPCQVCCEFFGNQPSTVEFVRLIPAPNLSPATLISSTVSEHRVEGVFEIDRVTPEHAGQYQCKTRSDSKEVAFNINFLVVQKATVNRSGSTQIRFNNGTREFICEAAGVPTPGLSFHGEGHYKLNFLDFSSPDYQLDVRSGVNSTRTVLHIHDEEKWKGLWFIYCLAGQYYTKLLYYDIVWYHFQ